MCSKFMCLSLALYLRRLGCSRKVVSKEPGVAKIFPEPRAHVHCFSKGSQTLSARNSLINLVRRLLVN